MEKDKRITGRMKLEDLDHEVEGVEPPNGQIGAQEKMVGEDL